MTISKLRHCEEAGESRGTKQSRATFPFAERLDCFPRLSPGSQ